MTALDLLAARCGIVASFRDARGEVQTASPETRRALLAAMGLDVADEKSAEAALAELDRVDAEEVLPPVCVLYQGDGPLELEVNLPAGTPSIAWHLQLENGTIMNGAARLDAVSLREKIKRAVTERERHRLVLGTELPFGYHALSVEPGAGRTVLIVTPGQCWLPAKIQAGHRLWGVAAQLYLLRSDKNWGIGDFDDLTALAQMLIPRGADVIGLNPLHAMFLDDPEHASPYSPANRLQLNVLNIDVSGLAALMCCSEVGARLDTASFKRALRQCREAPLLDYAAVAALKLPILRQVFSHCAANRDGAQRQLFEAFRRKAGETFERGCLYQALREHLTDGVPSNADWHVWPVPYRDPDSPAVAQFAEAHAEAVTFHAWLQFIADSQLRAAAEAATPMAIGLYRDLAVGADRAGAETWGNQRAVVDRAQVGAPPDIYNPAGQNWGLPPFNPRALRQEAYRSYVELVRANMRHAGGLRIDHVMALQQLYWVPAGRSPAEGAYVRYPLDDLVGILALESHRNQCLVVGEDLGTVPEGFRERMASANILSYRVLFFEKDAAGFIEPERYPALALAVAGSHDLPTLRAWWEEGDLKLKEKLHLFPTVEHAAQAAEERRKDRSNLLQAFARAGLNGNEAMPVEELIQAAHSFLASSSSALAMVQIDDLTDEATPVNVPTTSHEHPNWRRRQSLTLGQLADDGRLRELADSVNQQRRAHNPSTGRNDPANAKPRI